MPLRDQINKRSKRKSGRGRRPKRSSGQVNGLLLGMAGLVLMLALAGGVYYLYTQNMPPIAPMTGQPTPTAIDIVGAGSQESGLRGTSAPLIAATAFPATATRSVATRAPVTVVPATDVPALVNTNLLDAAYNASGSDDFRFSLNFTTEVTYGGQQYLFELIGDGVYDSGNSLADFQMQVDLDGRFAQPGAPEALFEVNVRMIQESVYFRVVAIQNTPGSSTPWLRLGFSDLLNTVAVDVDPSASNPAVEDLFSMMDFSQYVTLREVPAAAGDTDVQFQRDIDLLGLLTSEQAAELFVEALQRSSEDFDLGMTPAELKASYTLTSGLLRRSVSMLEIRTNEFVNRNMRRLSGASLDVDLEFDPQQIAAILGTPGGVPGGTARVMIDVILNFSDYGGTFSISAPATWQDVVLDDTLGINPAGLTQP